MSEDIATTWFTVHEQHLIYESLLLLHDDRFLRALSADNQELVMSYFEAIEKPYQ